MRGLDFADAERGLSGTLRPAGPALLFDHEDVLAASGDASVKLSEGDGTAVVSVALDSLSLELELAPLGDPVSLEGPAAGHEELSACRVIGELKGPDRTEQLACLGIRSQGTDPDFTQLELMRSVAIAFSDGGMLALRAARPRGAEAHGDEEVVAVVAGPEGEVTRIDEALLSTQYDDAGRQVRANLELWPDGDEPGAPLRAAGSIVCGTTLPMDGRRLDVAFFRWSMGGRPGLGRYEVAAGAEAT